MELHDPQDAPDQPKAESASTFQAPMDLGAQRINSQLKATNLRNKHEHRFTSRKVASLNITQFLMWWVVGPNRKRDMENYEASISHDASFLTRGRMPVQAFAMRLLLVTAADFRAEVPYAAWKLTRLFVMQVARCRCSLNRSTWWTTPTGACNLCALWQALCNASRPRSAMENKFWLSIHFGPMTSAWLKSEPALPAVHHRIIIFPDPDSKS